MIELLPAFFWIADFAHGEFPLEGIASYVMDMLKIIFVCITIPDWFQRGNHLSLNYIKIPKIFYYSYIIAETILSVLVCAFLVLLVYKE